MSSVVTGHLVTSFATKVPTDLKFFFLNDPVTAALRYIRYKANALKCSLSEPAKHMSSKPPSERGLVHLFRVFKLELPEGEFKKLLKEGVMERTEGGHYEGHFDFMAMKTAQWHCYKMKLGINASQVLPPVSVNGDAQLKKQKTEWEFWIPVTPECLQLVLGLGPRAAGAEAAGAEAEQPVKNVHAWTNGEYHERIWKLVKK